MRAASRLLLAAGALLAALGAAGAAAQSPGLPPPAPKAPAGPTVRLGALLPLSGPGAWFGKEMRQGMELALAALNRTRGSAAAPPGAGAEGAAGGASAAGTASGDQAGGEAAAGDDLRAPGVTLALEAADVQPLDVKHARDELARLAALPVLAVFTASTGPTLAIQSAAASRDVLVVHQGVLTDRFPAVSRTLLHTRPAPAARVAALLGVLAERGTRRLGVLSAGDAFGKAVRAAAAAGWRARGGAVTEVSLNLDGPDVATSLRDLVRGAPEAVVLGFRGPDLGDVAARLRGARYAGPLYCLDDDRAARLAGGAALDGATVVSDAFVPEPGSWGERFAQAYRARYGAPPSRYAARAFDAVAVLAEGIRHAMEEGGGVPGGGRLRESLRGLTGTPSVYGGAAGLAEDGTLGGGLTLFTVERGELTRVRTLAAASGRS